MAGPPPDPRPRYTSGFARTGGSANTTHPSASTSHHRAEDHQPNESFSRLRSQAPPELKVASMPSSTSRYPQHSTRPSYQSASRDNSPWTSEYRSATYDSWASESEPRRFAGRWDDGPPNASASTSSSYKGKGRETNSSRPQAPNGDLGKPPNNEQRAGTWGGKQWPSPGQPTLILGRGAREDLSAHTSERNRRSGLDLSTLWTSGFPLQTTEQDLERLFSTYGEV